MIQNTKIDAAWLAYQIIMYILIFGTAAFMLIIGLVHIFANYTPNVWMAYLSIATLMVGTIMFLKVAWCNYGV